MNKGWFFVLVGGVGAAAAAAFLSPPSTSDAPHASEPTREPARETRGPDPRAADPHAMDPSDPHGSDPHGMDPADPHGSDPHAGMNAGPLAPGQAEGPLPPGHPAIGSDPSQGQAMPPGHPLVQSGQGAMPPAAGADDEPSAPLEWKAPDAWRKVPNPNSMRLATYRCPAAGGEEPELAVSMAGGNPESNIARWIGQFETQGRGEPKREQLQVAGLKVWVVQVNGTYLAGSMSGGEEKKKGWTLLGAIVETQGPATFFKMTGPTAAVEKQRGAFDALLKSLRVKTPRTL